MSNVNKTIADLKQLARSCRPADSGDNPGPNIILVELMALRAIVDMSDLRDSLIARDQELQLLRNNTKELEEANQRMKDQLAIYDERFNA